MSKQTRNIDVQVALICAAFFSTLLIAAGCSENEEDAVAATQVAARVNGDEITVHQINFALERNQPVTPEVNDESKRKILDQLIGRQLATQKAIENKLDRSPKVMQAIESAKTEILARAYFEGLAASIPSPLESETEKFYEEHPELFSQRRLFDIEEFVLLGDEHLANTLRGQLSEGRSMPEVASWLRNRGTNFTANYGMRTAEQTSLEVLATLQNMSAGEIRVINESGGRLRVIRIVKFKVEPLDKASAIPRIQRFLMNRRAGEIIAREITELKEIAKITYLGEFATDGVGEDAGMKIGIENNAEVDDKAQTN